MIFHYSINTSSTRPQHWSTRLLPQPAAVLSFHTWLFSHTRQQPDHQVPRWHHRYWPYKQRRWNAVQRRSIPADAMVQGQHLSLYWMSSKVLIMEIRNNWGPHSPISLDGTPVEIVSSFCFLGLQIFDDLAWTHNTGAMLKKARQHLYPLRCLRKCGIRTRWLMNFYRGTIESIMSGGVTVWYGNTTAQDRKTIRRVIRMAEKIIECTLPSIEEILRSRCQHKASSIIQDGNHLGHQLFSPLRFACRCRGIRTGTSAFKLNSFYPQAVRLLNCSSLNYWTLD